MKRFITTCLILISCNANAQGWLSAKNLDFLGLGVGYTNMDINTKQGSNGFFLFSVSLSGLYVDFGSNAVNGEGEYLNYNSGQYTYGNKRRATSVNLGWNLRTLNGRFIITPKIGWIDVDNVINDYGGYNTYYYTHYADYYTVGANISYYFNDYIGFTLGASTKQQLSIQVSFKTPW